MSRSKSLRLLMVLIAIACLTSPASADMILGPYDSADAPSGKGKPPKPQGPPIDLFTVALHEFGHSLGLPHSDPNDQHYQVMDPYYIGPVSGLDDWDVAWIQAKYPEPGIPPKNFSLGRWANTAITYSFTPDGARMDQGGRNVLFSTLDKAIGLGQWEGIFEAALNAWSAATALDGGQTVLSFTPTQDNGAAFNAAGSSQGDSRFGDIRIGAHTFDGASGVLAHAYYPPPNGYTAAGDLHLDKAENWQDLRSNAGVTAAAGQPGESADTSASQRLVLNGAPVPEPSTLWLLCIGGVCVVANWWRKRKR